MKWASVDATGEVPVRRSAHSTALVDSRYLYVFGGWDGQEELGDLHVLDTGERRFPDCGMYFAARCCEQ
jgi:hypothetical protein